MKILIITDYFQPILGYTPTYLWKELIKQWHEILIFTSDHYYPFPDYKNTSGKILWPRKQKIWFTHEEWLPTMREKMEYEIFNRCKISNTEKNIKDFWPDYIIMSWIASITAIEISKLKNKYNFKLVCFDSHLMSVLNDWFLWKSFYFIFRILFSKFLEKKVDKFIWVQEETCEIINKYYWISKKRIEFIPLWTDTEKFKFDKKERTLLRKKYNLTENAIVLIYTGKLIKEKWYELLIKATSKVIRNNNNVYVCIIGSWSDEYIWEVNKEIKDIKQNYIFENFVKNQELYKYYSMSDIWIWPLQESVTMVEAAACNLPFIANDKIGTKLRISNNNAILYEQWNTEDLYEKIKYLVENKQERVNMWKRGRDLVEEKLSWKNISKEYLKV